MDIFIGFMNISLITVGINTGENRLKNIGKEFLQRLMLPCNGKTVNVRKKLFYDYAKQNIQRWPFDLNYANV